MIIHKYIMYKYFEENMKNKKVKKKKKVGNWVEDIHTRPKEELLEMRNNLRE